GIIRVWSHEFINPRTVQIDFTVSISWQLAEGFFELSQGTIDFESWVVGIVGFPYRDGRTPVPVTGNSPVAGIFQPFSELAVLDVARDPVDVFVAAQHVVFEVSDFDIPGGNCPVNQRGAATPAVRIRVLKGLFCQQRALGT